MRDTDQTYDLDFIRRLVSERAVEGTSLEFKESVPVSPEQQRAQSKAGELVGGKAVDKAVQAGTGIGEYGRNKLLEEIVAFANAGGGRLIIGVVESDTNPPRAEALQSICYVEALERRLSDQIIDQIEPRLPHFSTKAVLLDGGDQGFLIIDVEASLLGPHWLRSTRSATVRRGDKCVLLSMYEVHDMVLRNARRFDNVRKRLDEFEKCFEPYFLKEANTMVAKQANLENYFGLDSWLASHRDRGIIGIRTSIVPHQSLSLKRLETLKNIVCAGAVETIDAEGRKTSGFRFPFTSLYPERQILGGAEHARQGHNVSTVIRAERDGSLNTKTVWLFDSSQTFSTPWLLGIVGNTLAMFDKLRIVGNSAHLAAELSVETLRIGTVNVQPLDGWINDRGVLPDKQTLFDIFTISDPAGFDACLNEIAGDFVNAIGMSVSTLPTFRLAYS